MIVVRAERHRHVTIISQLPPPVHGSTVVTKRLVESLTSAGERVHLVDRRFSGSVSEIGSMSLRKVWSAFGLMARLLRQSSKSDVCVFFVTNRPASFLVDWALSEVLRIARTPTINYVHTNGFVDLAKRGRLWNWMTRRLLQQAALTVCLSHGMVPDVAKWVPSTKVRIIANAVDEEVPSRSTSQQVLFLSNLLSEKGADTFVKAAIALSRTHPEASFVLAGPATDQVQLEALRAEISRAGLEKTIELRGAVDADVRSSLMRGSRMLVFPSRYRYEAQPLVIIEAFAFGLPVVAFDTGAIGDLVPDGIAGYVLPEKDLEGLISAAARLLDDDELHAGLRQGAHDIFRSVHSPNIYIERWRAVLTEVRSE